MDADNADEAEMQVVLHEDKKYYPTANEVYGQDVEVMCNHSWVLVAVNGRTISLSFYIPVSHSLSDVTWEMVYTWHSN